MPPNDPALHAALVAQAEAERRVALYQHELARGAQQWARARDQVAELRGRLTLAQDQTTALAAAYAAQGATLARVQADLADANHTLARMQEVLTELGRWVRASKTNADLLTAFYVEWGITRPTPPRPPPPWGGEEAGAAPE